MAVAPDAGAGRRRRDAGDDAGYSYEDDAEEYVPYVPVKQRRLQAMQRLGARGGVRGVRAEAGEDAEQRERDAATFQAEQLAARAVRNTFRAKVLEGQALQARVEVAALRGDYAAANAAWDRLFDVVTAIRSLEGGYRRKHGGVADPAKVAAYDAARAGRLKISQWSQGKQLVA